jgi:hypothetical protein
MHLIAALSRDGEISHAIIICDELSTASIQLA